MATHEIKAYLDDVPIVRYTDDDERQNIGKVWSERDELDLRQMWKRSECIEAMASQLGRTVGSVIARLEQHRVIFRPVSHDGRWEARYQSRYYHAIYNPKNVKPINEKEPVMANAAKPIETLTFIFGTESKNVDDAALFAHIQRLENQIVELNNVKNKPKKLKAQIEQLQADIDALVKHCDER